MLGSVHVRGRRLARRLAQLPAVGRVGLGAELRLPYGLGAPLPEAGGALRGVGGARAPLVTGAGRRARGRNGPSWAWTFSRFSPYVSFHQFGSVMPGYSFINFYAK